MRWGLREAWIGVAVATVGGLIGGAGIVAIAAAVDGVPFEEYGEDISLSVQALAQIPLWAGYLGVPWLVTRTMGNGLRADLHLSMRWTDVPLGLFAGSVTQIALIPLLYLPVFWLTDLDPDELSSAARDLTDKATDPVGVVLLVIVVVVMAPLIEELFYRGLFQRAADRRYGTAGSILLPAFVFGAIHFQLLQLPALVLFGVVAGTLTWRFGRLGPAIWAHVGFNGLAVASLLAG